MPRDNRDLPHSSLLSTLVRACLGALHHPSDKAGPLDGYDLTVGPIDVFADAPLSGNPLAVVQGGEDLDDATLRRIAGEFNQAETTFILPSARGDHRLRSFTASGAEVFGAGHNALGAWLRLSDALSDAAPPTAALGLSPGDVLPDPAPRPADTGAAHLMVARFFNPTVGLWEDAATGTAAGPLAAYLAATGHLQGDELAIEQGTRMGRRSILRIRLTPDPELSGAGVIVLEGRLRL